MSTATELRALEERLLQSDFRRNRQVVAELLAEDFREFGSSGHVWNKQQILDQLETGPPLQASLQDFEARELASGAVLVTYKATVQYSGTKTVTSLRSSIWIRRNGHWQVVFHQGSLQIP